MNNLVNSLVWVRRKIFIRASADTMAAILPFLVIGVFAEVISSAFLSTKGFGADILHINAWVKEIPQVQRVFMQVTGLTTGLLALFAAYKNAEFTTYLKKTESHFAGLTAMISYLLLISLPSHAAPFNFSMEKTGISADNGLFGIQGLLFGLLVGYVVGLIFARFEKITTRNVSLADGRSYQVLLPIFMSLLLVTFVGLILSLLTNLGVFDWIATSIRSYSSQKNSFLMTLLGSFITGILNWLGLSGPFDYSTATQDSIMASSNALYAIQHHSIWNIPYPYSELSLYHSYATFGGVGATLALIIAIVIVSKNSRDLTTVRWGLFPALFNNNSILMLGVPVFFNVIYLIPFLLVPIINMLVVSVLIYFHITPPVPFPVPIGTPGPLVGLIGTGGNIAALFTGLLVFVLDIFLYIPFVKVNDRVNDAYVETKEGVLDETH